MIKNHLNHNISVYTPFFGSTFTCKKKEKCPDLRLHDYEPEIDHINTHSCKGFGVCHSTPLTGLSDIDKNGNHVCQRLFQTTMRKKQDVCSSIFFSCINKEVWKNIWPLCGLLCFVFALSLSSIKLNN